MEATATATVATTETPPPPPSERRAKRQRRQVTPILFRSEGGAASLGDADDRHGDVLPDHRRGKNNNGNSSSSSRVAAAAAPAPRPPPLDLSADELRRLQARGPAELLCALDACAMRDPVVTPSGLTFERGCAERWVARWGVDPATGAALRKGQLYPNLAVRDRLVSWLESEGRAEFVAAQAAAAAGGEAAAAAAAAAAAGAEAAAAAREGRRADVDAEID